MKLTLFIYNPTYGFDCIEQDFKNITIDNIDTYINFLSEEHGFNKDKIFHSYLTKGE